MKIPGFCLVMGNNWYPSENLFSVILSFMLAISIGVLCAQRNKKKAGMLPLWIVVAIVNSFGAMVFWYWYMFPDPTFPELAELESNLVSPVYFWSAIVTSFVSICIWLLIILRNWVFQNDNWW